MSNSLTGEPRVVAMDVSRYFNHFLSHYVRKGDNVGIGDLQDLLREFLMNPSSEGIANYIVDCSCDNDRTTILLYRFLTEYIAEIAGILCGVKDEAVECLSVVFDQKLLMTVTIIRYHV